MKYSWMWKVHLKMKGKRTMMVVGRYSLEVVQMWVGVGLRWVVVARKWVVVMMSKAAAM
jgi:hypothetical protein